MGKDSTNNILYLLGVIGSIMALINSVYYFVIGTVVPGGIDRLLVGGGLMLIGIALLGVYRAYGNYIPIIAMIYSILYQVIGTLLFPLLGPHILFWTLGGINIWLTGYVFYLTRDKIGVYATISGIILLIWGAVNVVIKYLNFVATGSSFGLNLFAGIAFAMFIVLIYFIFAIRSED